LKLPFRNKLLIIAAIALIFTGYFYYVTSNKAIDFSLNNWDEKKVSMRDLRDKVVVMTFSYSNCSARCPVVTVRLKSLDELMNAPEDVVYLHVSIDPEMDTPESMKKYFGLYKLDPVKDRRWMFVSGQENDLLKVWEFYGIEIEKIKDKSLPEGYYMEYNPMLVLIDKRGFIKHQEDFYFEEDNIIKRIKEIT
jgi:protein SCO1/2